MGIKQCHEQRCKAYQAVNRWKQVRKHAQKWPEHLLFEHHLRKDKLTGYWFHTMTPFACRGLAFFSTEMC